MQEENRLFQTFFDRLEKLRLGQAWSWDECAQKIGISKAMLFFMRSKKQSISKKSWFKLEQAERAAGLTPALPSAKPESPNRQTVEPTEEALPAGVLAAIHSEMTVAQEKVLRELEAMRGDLAEMKEIIRRQAKPGKSR